MNLLENSQIIPQKEALDVRFSKKFVSGSLKVIEGHQRSKIGEKARGLSERLKGSWSTYNLERSERLKRSWSAYNLE